MLALVVNLFNFFGSCVYVVFIWSYSVGKVMFTFSYQAINLFFSLIWNVVASISLLFDEFSIFWIDLENNLNKGWLGMSETMDEIAKSIGKAKDLAKKSTTAFLNVRKLRLEDCGKSVVFAAKWFFDITRAGLLLLSEILWFLVTLLPNIVIRLCSTVVTAVFLLLDVFTRGYCSVLSLSCEIYNSIIERVRNKPLRCFVEVFILILIIANSFIILKMLQQFTNLLYRRVRQNIQHFVARYLRNRQSIRVQTSTRARSPLRSSLRNSRRLLDYNKTDMRPASPESDTLNGETEGVLCVICQERARCVVLFPCKHLCLCEECSFNLTSYQKVCPLCRIYINNQLRVYV